MAKSTGHWQGDTAERLHAEADGRIRALYAGRSGWAARERTLDLKVRACCATLREEAEALAAFQHLYYLRPGGTAPIASPTPVLPFLGPSPGNTGPDALLHLARFHRHWLRPPAEWSPPADTGTRAHVASLARHLLARYPLPAFLDAAWLSGFTEEGEQHRRWFAHLGRGDRLEALRFPLPMTHRAAHHFLRAPDDFPVVGALRFGQVRALGGGDALGRALAGTFLAEAVQPDEPFWLTVVQFLVNYPQALPAAQVGPVVDYLRWRRFGADGVAGEEPGLSMKGRKPDALLRSVSEWHESLARRGRQACQHWDGSSSGDIAPLASPEQDDPLSPGTCQWRIVEITDSVALQEEGRVMRHCVRTYQNACARGATAIWSLRLHRSDDPAPRRLLTIEVNRSRRAIVQVRAKCNQTLPALQGNRRMAQARDVLREWARCQRLAVACPL